MRLITSPTELSETFQSRLDTCTTIHIAAAWAAIGFPAYDALVKARNKIGRAVIGTHFCQTAPEFIEKFANDTHVRFVDNHMEVFHPKFYVFKGIFGKWACIIGSPNFTVGGFVNNYEAALLVTEADDAHGNVLKQALASIDLYWSKAVPGKNINLVRYKAIKKQFVKPMALAAGQFGDGRPGLPIENIDVLNKSWDEFLVSVQGDRHEAVAERLQVLSAARKLFGTTSFAEMDDDQRKGIAGFGNQQDEVPWIWFGNMSAPGWYKNLVNKSPKGFSDALDKIPFHGEVTEENYHDFVSRFVQSFPVNEEGSPVGHGVATATRLLAMKRPDYFVCLDSANRRAICEAFGVSKTLDYRGYWDKIVERVKLANWWNAPRPIENEAGQIWDGRAAMLDAIYYSSESRQPLDLQAEL